MHMQYVYMYYMLPMLEAGCISWSLYILATMHGRAIQCKHTHNSAVLSEAGKGRQSNKWRVFPVFHVAHKTLQTYGFPIQTYG